MPYFPLANDWNGVPIPVTHPRKNDSHVFANSLEFEEKQDIGKPSILDSSMAVFWEKSRSILRRLNGLASRQDIITGLESRKKMKASAGLFPTAKQKKRMFNHKAPWYPPPHTMLHGRPLVGGMQDSQ